MGQDSPQICVVTLSPTGQVIPGSKPSPQVYEDLIRTRAKPGEFCTSFTELQRDFVKRRPAKLKNLLRLVKHWYKEVRCPALPQSLIPPLLLLTGPPALVVTFVC